MGTTSKGLRYPAPTDPIRKGAQRIQELASDVDTLLDTIKVGPAGPPVSDADVANWLSTGALSGPAFDARAQLLGDARYTRLSRLPINVRDYGATGDGSTDDTAAIAAADAAAKSAGRTIYFPAGTYLVSSIPAPNSGQSFTGDGQDKTIIRYTGTGTLLTMTGKSRVKFDRLCLTALTATAILAVLDGSFRCTFTDVRLQGAHTGSSGTTYYAQVGVDIINNAGDNTFLNCDVLNFGIGYRTTAIQNFIIGGKVGTCHVDIYGGTGGGFSISGVDFVSGYGNTPEITAYNIQIPGAAGQWWIDQCWFEGADIGMSVGSTTDGPTQFNVTSCKIAATSKGIDLKGARQSVLGGIQFSSNGSATPTPLTIGAAATEGNAFGLINITSGLGTDPFLTAFPNGVGGTPGWTYLGRTTVRLPADTRIPFGGGFTWTRSDGAVAGKIALSGSTVVLNSVNTASSAGAFSFRDNGGARMFDLGQVTNAVNYVRVTSAITATKPKIEVDGTDTNIGLDLVAKGTGSVVHGSATNKVGFFGADGQTKQALPAAATDLATTITLVNAIRTLLINHGLAS